ncbi:MAG TPA: phosphoribosylglycinamide formyltransferase [Steroidobacteraceae bacterium]
MTGGDPLRLAILISGRGSNMAAIARACAEERINARVDLVLSERPGAAGLDTARALGIETGTVAWPGAAERMQFELGLEAALTAARPDVIVLAGFMRILSQQFVAARAGRMLNIHPSLLPKYRGLHTHRRVLESGDRVHGASVHFVTAELDGGPLILQSRVAVRPGDTEDTLSARVQATEHTIYPQVIGWLAAGRLAWRGDRPWLDGKPLDAPIVEDFPLTDEAR